LARTLDGQVRRHLPSGGVDDAGLKRSRKLVAWLFAATRRQLAAVIATRAGAAAVQVGAGPSHPERSDAALEALSLYSGEVQWPRAIESATHPLHPEWLEFKTWAHGEGLFVRARMELDPVLARHTFWLEAWPL